MGGIDIIGLLGLILGVFFYYKSKIEKRPTFAYQDTLLQSRSCKEISIFFQDERITSLRRLRVIFFNKGRKEIRSEDNPPSNFPAIHFPSGTRIVASNILCTSNPTCGFQAKKVKDSSLELSFDYLNHNDGGVVEVMYDGGEIVKPEIKFSAFIIGALPARSFKFVDDEQNPKIGSMVFMAAMNLALFSLCIIMFIATWRKLQSEGLHGEIFGYFTFATVLTIFSIFGAWANFVLPFSNGVPKWAKSHFGDYK